MKIAVVGATGTIGAAVAHELEQRGHQVVRAARGAADAIDIEDVASIRAFYAAHPDLDAVVSATGRAAMGAAHELGDEGYALCVQSKQMGQVNLVREAARSLPGATVVLTTGILAHAPWPGTAAVAMVNAAIEGFVRAAALDLKDRRVLVVSPPLVRESAIAWGMGEVGPFAAEVARTYADALESGASGSVHFVPGYAP